MKKGAKPRFSRVPFTIGEKFEIENDCLGTLEPVKFSMPVVLIMKKDGSIRLCGDYRVTVNPAMETDTYPLLHIKDMLASMAGGAIFSKLDLAQQVVLDEVAKFGHYNRTEGFVLCEAPPIWSCICSFHVPANYGEGHTQCHHAY